jgi:hypothetical protein
MFRIHARMGISKKSVDDGTWLQLGAFRRAGSRAPGMMVYSTMKDVSHGSAHGESFGSPRSGLAGTADGVHRTCKEFPFPSNLAFAGREKRSGVQVRKME